MKEISRKLPFRQEKMVTGFDPIVTDRLRKVEPTKPFLCKQPIVPLMMFDVGPLSALNQTFAASALSPSPKP
jgi:hypothetical protein